MENLGSKRALVAPKGGSTGRWVGEGGVMGHRVQVMVQLYKTLARL